MAKPKHPAGKLMAYQLREANYRVAMQLAAVPDDQITPVERSKALSASTRAWVESDERVRVHRGKPLPTAASYAASKQQRNGRWNRRGQQVSASPAVEEQSTNASLVAAPVESAAMPAAVGRTVQEKKAEKSPAPIDESAPSTAPVATAQTPAVSTLATNKNASEGNVATSSAAESPASPAIE